MNFPIVISYIFAALGGLFSLGAIATFIRQFWRRRNDRELGKLLAELSLKEQKNQTIADEDIERVMGKLSIAAYATSPQDRRLIVQELLAAMARQRQGQQPRVTVTTSGAGKVPIPTQETPQSTPPATTTSLSQNP